MAVGVGRQRAASLLPYIVKTLRKESLNPANQTLPSLRRMFSLYDQINIIDSVPEDQLRFKAYSETGFTINEVKYEGSLLIVENKIMSWAPKVFSEINAESLSIFKILRPVPEVLILGCGRHIEPVNPELRKYIRSIGMKLEAIDSRNAASTYNILNEEGRMVAAALLPCGVSS
ncbi:hypothetical protein IEQ34_022415 [Dendrobium chrysotoxum]|uniref:NADH dehydrogenase [ubiquinone] 1 alpha subcomplex assembly factor 3 n=1 Tax=Dendrobium chrysotoxum TaxID=161865 RepID=A0AAV7FXE6_DENCH|nr:hypothetical protein IEQ34_022415 [Dendrobium chrysotoxum]